MFITCKTLLLKTAFLNPIFLLCNKAAEKWMYVVYILSHGTHDNSYYL
jgi:hypothetical protein